MPILTSTAKLREIVHAFTDLKWDAWQAKNVSPCKARTMLPRGRKGYTGNTNPPQSARRTLYSAVGAAGELFAVRRELFEEMQTDTLLDDFILSLRIVMQGHTIAYCANAYAVESGSADMREEEKRKGCASLPGLQSIWRLRPLLNPFRYGTFCFQYISHRVLRWSLTPILLFLLLPLNTILIFTTSTPLLYAIIWLLQALFYLMGSWGYYLSMKHIKNKILFIPYYFLFMNVNVIRGFNYLHKRKGNASGAWEKARRA